MLKGIFASLIPSRTQQDIIAYSHAKNIVGAALIALIAAPFFAYCYYSLHYDAAAFAIILEWVVIFLAIIILKNTQSIVIPREMIVSSLVLCLTWLTYHLGGVFSPPAYWLVLPPLAAIFFGGVRSGVIWSALCLCIILAFYIFQSTTIPFTYLIQSNELFLQIVSISGLILIILMLAYFFENGKREAIQAVERIQTELQAAKDKEFTLAKIAESNRLLSNILDSSIDYSIIATNLDGIILTWNAGATRNYLYTAHEMIDKKNIQMLYENVMILREGMEHSKPNTAGLVLKCIRKNNDTFSSSTVINIRHDTVGKPIGYLFITHDISEKIKLEEQLKKYNQELVSTTGLLNNILESSIDYAIVALDLEGTILSWNSGASHIYGYAATDVIGKQNLRILLPKDEAGTYAYQRLLEMANKGEKVGEIFERVRKNGDKFLALVDINLRRDHDNIPIGYIMISKDLSQKIFLEEQVKINKELDERNTQIMETSRLKNSFLANMSHELRTPLNAILGFSELMNAEALGSITAEQKLALNDMIYSGRDLLRLIDDILDLSKIESGKIILKPRNVDIPKLTYDVVNTLQPLFQKKELSVTVNIDSNIHIVFIDPDRLKQVFYNYLSNAIKFTPNNGSIKLRVITISGDMFRIEVEDNGIGIKSEDIPKLFIEFQQLDSSTTKRYAGTGLGLALVKHVVEVQGGKVGLTSTFGNGSTFYAILPQHYQENIT